MRSIGVRALRAVIESWLMIVTGSTFSMSMRLMFEPVTDMASRTTIFSSFAGAVGAGATDWATSGVSSSAASRARVVVRFRLRD